MSMWPADCEQYDIVPQLQVYFSDKGTRHVRQPVWRQGTEWSLFRHLVPP